MHQGLASAAVLHVTYRPDSCLLIGRWLCSITEAQLREGYETMRLAALEYRCSHWLVDARRRVDRRLNGPEWVVTTFLPKVQRELSSHLYVAFLVLPNHLRELEADAGQPLTTPSTTSSFRYARFIDEGAANAWLEEHSREGK